MSNLEREQEFLRQLRLYENARDSGEAVFMDVDELCDIVEYYQVNGKLDDAMECVDYALTIYPDHLPLIGFKARLLVLRDGNLDEAYEWLYRMDDHDSVDYHYLQAELLIAEGRIEEADTLMQEVYDNSDEDDRDDLGIDMAMLYADYEQPALALEWLRRSELTTHDDYQETKARILAMEGNYAEAAEIFERLIDDNPYSTFYWVQLATAQFMLQRTEESINSCEYAIAIEPTNREALVMKASGLNRLGNAKGAKEYFDLARKYHPHDVHTEMCDALAQMDNGHPQEALALLRRAEQYANGRQGSILDEIHMEQVRILLMLNRTDEAIKIIEEDIARFIRLSDTETRGEWHDRYDLLAFVDALAGRRDAFLDHLAKGVECAPQYVTDTLAPLFPEGMDVKEYVEYAKTHFDNIHQKIIQ